MRTKNNFSEQLFAYFIIGVAIVLGIAALIIFSWLAIAGAIIGVILYLIALARAKFFKQTKHPSSHSSQKIGRTFDHDDSDKHS